MSHSVSTGRSLLGKCTYRCPVVQNRSARRSGTAHTSWSNPGRRTLTRSLCNPDPQIRCWSAAIAGKRRSNASEKFNCSFSQGTTSADVHTRTRPRHQVVDGAVTVAVPVAGRERPVVPPRAFCKTPHDSSDAFPVSLAITITVEPSQKWHGGAYPSCPALQYTR